jgi:hypothetical protein
MLSGKLQSRDAESTICVFLDQLAPLTFQKLNVEYLTDCFRTDKILAVMYNFFDIRKAS